ncbi:MAG: translesion error-prone DNA polymerase V autoproteolytic subunit [Nitrosomonadales bacterium]|nr:translesion error-prone DNA polymerase V autoproteolytic subunit [Nitrosomonadales bacterium]
MKSIKNKNTRGGFRLGAGRKPGSGLYGEETKVMRIPRSSVSNIKKYLNLSRANNVEEISLAYKEITYNPLFLFEHKVPAGFPSPADDHIEKRLDLNEYLIKKSDTTFFVKIKGDSMIDASINDGDIVIIDRSMQAKIGDIVLASVDGNFTIKTLSKYKLKPRLLPANEKYKPIEINEDTQFELWGVVTGAVRKFK